MRPALCLVLALSAFCLRAGSDDPPKAAPTAPTVTTIDFVGRWEGTDDTGITAAFEFGGDGYATLHMKGQVLGGRGTGTPSMRYHLDFTHSPIWMDFIAEDGAGKELGRLLAIVELLSPSELRVMIHEDASVRPAGFHAATPKNCVTLKRRP
ncbi:MAG: hypothetical protein HXX12_11615 [Geothrix sp.]|uniref:hypothetical protein n=1 Tax=Geothrix sp. TaxID=1962974 RepID=UPI0017A51DD0|nr:hypothetical protein [Geothrix sp.]NWJ41606.1 hypothetical protein [Geothrix sp.]WIL20412.1 MAG: hypothetical protein QOZ81_002981 [Geothrix sp.]